MRRVALTGGIATGKSHVRALFEQLGVPTVDADILARDAVAPGTPGLAAAIERFGPDIVDSRGLLDRRKLASIVFSDAAARRDLEQIVHPAVRQATSAFFDALAGSAHPFAIADIPLLFETGRHNDFDAVIVTACSPATQLRRIVDRDAATELDARRRIEAQLPIAEKVHRADYVINTEGTFEDTERQVRAVWSALGGR